MYPIDLEWENVVGFVYVCLSLPKLEVQKVQIMKCMHYFANN